MSWKLSYKKAYGLTMEGSHVHVAAAERRGRRIETRHVCTADLSRIQEQPGYAVMMADIQSGQAFIQAAFPPEMSLHRCLQIPLPSHRKALQVAPSLLDTLIPFPVEKSAAAFTEPVKKQGQWEIHAVVTRIPLLEDWLDNLQQAHLDPFCVDDEASAYWEGMQREMGDTAESTLLIVLEEHHTRIIIGAGTLQHVYATGIGVSALQDDAALKQRWAPWVAHALRQHPVKRCCWLCIGEQSIDPESLERELALADVPHHRLAKPASFAAEETARRALDPAVCLDLRGRAAPHAGLVDIRKRNQRRQAVIAAAAALVIIVAATGFRLAGQLRVRSLQQQIYREAASLYGPGIQRGQEVLMVERMLQDERQRLQPFIEVFEPSVAQVTAALVTRAAERGLSISMLAVQSDGIVIEGSSEAWNDCDQLLPLLDEYGWQAVPQQEEDPARERVRFRIQGGRADAS